MTTKDKKIELMVLTSTSHVAPHIAGCSSSVVINLTQVELQMVLISTVSTFFLSTLSSSFSCLDLVHEDPARSLRLRPLPCEQQQRHSESRKETNKQFRRAAAGSNGVLRVLRVESGRHATSRRLQQEARERQVMRGVAPPGRPLPSAVLPCRLRGVSRRS